MLFIFLLLFFNFSLLEIWHKPFKMGEKQIIARGITNIPTIEARKKVSPYKFVTPEQAKYAYGHFPLIIGYRKTISEPYFVTSMIAAFAEIPSHFIN